MLHGRDAERAAIGGLLEGARASRSAALVIRGEAGVGKSALLADTADRADDMYVLRARGVESESDLPFAAVQGLMRPALDRLDALPAPQARALGTALGLAEGPPPERFLVYSACLGLVSELAEQRPVLCLVDDAHWLDTPSAEALTFVARRLGAEGIVLLFSAREGEERRFVADGVASLDIGGLDAEAARALLAASAGDAAPGVVERLIARTGGNALALVELPGALSDGQPSGAGLLPAALPMTRELEAIGAEPWAERARGELRASGETARRRGPDVASTLTSQERQIAAMVGHGLTNKEVAAQLYLSPRTIDAHLRGVFAKLGIVSRRELRDVDLGTGSRSGTPAAV